MVALQSKYVNAGNNDLAPYIFLYNLGYFMQHKTFN